MELRLRSGLVIKNKNYYVDEINSDDAKKLMVKYHYSGKVVPNSKLHIGVFCVHTNELMGVLSYGTPMNATKTPQKIVKDSTQHTMYELNRMAMTDDAPKFSESQAISLCNKWVKINHPHIDYILSYSDGKEGNVGIIYQATNWVYLGYNESNSFYDLDGTIMHKVTSWHRHREGRTCGRTEMQIMKTMYKNISQIYSRQYIYVFPLKKGLTYNRDVITEYPKRENEPTIVKRRWFQKDGVECDFIEEYV